MQANKRAEGYCSKKFLAVNDELRDALQNHVQGFVNDDILSYGLSSTPSGRERTEFQHRRVERNRLQIQTITIDRFVVTGGMGGC